MQLSRGELRCGALHERRASAESILLGHLLAYRRGRMLYGGWGLADIPVIDYRLYEDGNAEGTYHLRHH